MLLCYCCTSSLISFVSPLGGDWAGNVFTSDGCGSDCTSAYIFRFGCSSRMMMFVPAFVNENPSSFTEAYWDFAALRVYQWVVVHVLIRCIILSGFVFMVKCIGSVYKFGFCILLSNLRIWLCFPSLITLSEWFYVLQELEINFWFSIK